MKILLVLLFGVTVLFAKNTRYTIKPIDFYEVDLAKHGAIGQVLLKAEKAIDLDSVLANYNKALKMAKKTNSHQLDPYILFFKGYTFFTAHRYMDAIVFLKQSLELADKYQLKAFKFQNHNLLAVIYNYQELYDLSIQHFQKSVQNTSNHQDEIYAKINISEVFINLKQPELASIYLQEFKTYHEAHPNQLDSFWVVYGFKFLAAVSKGNKLKMIYINKALSLAKEIDDLELELQCLQTKAQFLIIEKNYTEAIFILQKVVKLAVLTKRSEVTKKAYLDLAKIASSEKKHRNSLFYLDKVTQFESVQWLTLEIDSLYYENYHQLKEDKKAFLAAKKYITSLYKQSHDKQKKMFADYGKKYETEKKIQENKLLKQENTIKDLQVEKQKTNNNFLLLLSALGLILFAVTYNRFRLKRKTAHSLAAQNDIIFSQKKALEKSNVNKQRLFGIIAHDLVNPFNAILGYTKLLDDDYDGFSEQERKQFISIINTYATSNYKLTKTLLDWAKIQQDRLVVKKVKLNCNEIVKEAIQPYQVLADKKQIQIKINILAHTFIEADKNMMQTVIGNLVVNAIKFTPEKGEINLHLDKNKDGTVNLEIKDNGIGMSQEQLNNLFDITKVNTLKGTNNEKGNGLGLILCKELMELQQGTLQLFSIQNKGSRAVVTI